MYKLTLKHHFCAAHQLTHAYSSECNDNIHGHNWDVLVEIEREDLINGMVVDFKRIKEVINELDHKFLNKILPFEPTAENISKYLHHAIETVSLGSVKVTVWEAENASISYYDTPTN